MEIRQYGNTVCIHFSIKLFHIEGVVKKVKKAKKKKEYSEIDMQYILEHEAALREMERNKNAAQNLLRIKGLF